MKELKSGWAFDQFSGSVYSFEHMPLDDANALFDVRDSIYVVESINYTLADNGDSVHRNKYFALSLSVAIALAARCEIVRQEVAEDVVAIREATAEETDVFLRVRSYFGAKMPSAISTDAALRLPE